MKQLFIYLSIISLFILSGCSPDKPYISDANSQTSLISKSEEGRSFNLSGTVTINGCNIAYDVDISYTVIPPKVTRASGTLTLSGNCEGEISFDIPLKSNSEGVVEAPELPSNGNIDGSTLNQFGQFLGEQITTEAQSRGIYEGGNPE
jgi:hypothetical protein